MLHTYHAIGLHKCCNVLYLKSTEMIDNVFYVKKLGFVGYTVIFFRGWNRPKISRVKWALDINKLRALNLVRIRLVFLISFVLSYWNESTFSRAIWAPLVLKFCGPSANFEGNWPEGLPYFNPWFFHLSTNKQNLYNISFRCNMNIGQEYW